MKTAQKQQKQEALEKVEIGKRIEIAVNGEFQCWDVVEPGESSALDKKISVDAPLIQLISGLQSGEEARGKLGAREVVVKIREVYGSTKK